MKKIYKKIASILLIISTILSVSSVFAIETPQIIKVGYVKHYGMLKTPQTDGLNGYGYEYLDKISNYTEGNYAFEYVECTLENYEQMLTNGSIDIFAPAPYEASKVGSFIYSDMQFSTNSIFISDLKNANDICEEFEYLNGKTIATIKDATIVSRIQSFLDEKNVTAEIIQTEVKDFSDEKYNQDYDFVITSSLQMEHGISPIIKLVEIPVYFMTTSANQSLMNDVNSAMKKIEEHEYNFVNKLTLKYFDFNLTYKKHISDIEYALLRAKNSYNVGVVDTHTPFSYENKKGEVAGIAVDTLTFLFEDIDSELNFEFLPDNPTDSVLEGYDFLLLSNALSNNTDKRNSKTYAHIDFVMVTELGASSQNIGVLENYGINDSIIDYFAPQQKIKSFETTEELIKAFNDGQINSLFITESTFNMIISEINATNHTMENVGYVLNPVITYPSSFSDEGIETIDALLSYIPDDFIQYSLLKHSSLINEKDIWDYVFSPQGIAFMIIPVLVIALLALYFRADKKRHRTFNDMSKIDDLTGLYTEQEFIKRAKRILDKNPDGTYSILSLDVDNFKYINESSGYDVGTKVIRIISEFLHENAEAGMPSARRFADNFVILADTYGFVQKIENFLTEEHVLEKINTYLSREHPISFSIGRFTIEDKTVDISHMIDCANAAREVGKKTLGTTMHKYSDEIKRKSFVHNDVIASMNKAIGEKEFVLYYQLKVDLKELQLNGAEALVRWVSEDRIIPPNDFIPVFEENGFIEKLDYYVIEEACQFIQQNRGHKFPKISVNISGVTMMKKRMVPTLVAITQKYGIDPSELDLEITESAFVDHSKFSLTVVRKLRSLGFTISMDDFGTGISTLNRLKDIHFDTLKIDRGFIVDSLDNQRSTKIIENVIHMAKDLNLETVAEGIETPEQLLFLRNMGCEYGQGFYFSKPLPADEFLEILNKF